MSNIPDFVMQVQEVERQIEAQADVTSQDWKDNVQNRYYEKFIAPYSQYLNTYIHGGTGMSGKGINELLVYMDEQMQKMEQLSGVPAEVTFYAAAAGSSSGYVRDYYGKPIDVAEFSDNSRREGIVHNDRRERDYWDNEERLFSRGNGPRPGEYTNKEVVKVMEERQKDDFYKDFEF